MMNNNIKKYLICCLSGLFSFYSLTQLSLYNSIISNIALSFHLSSVQVGFISSAFVLANAIGLIPIGILIDRFSVVRISILFLSLSIFATFIIVSTTSWLILLLMHFVQGFTSAASLLTCVYVGAYCFNSRPNSVIGLIISFALLGGIFANDVFVHIVSYMGWREGLLSIAFFGLIVLISWILLLNNEQPLLNQKNQFFKFELLRSAFHNKKILFPGLYLGLMSLPIFILASLWGNFYLCHVYSLNHSQAALAVSFLFVGLMIGSPITGYCADKLHNSKFIMVLGAMGSLVAFIPFLMPYFLTEIQIALLLFLLGVTISTQNVVYIEVATQNPKEISSLVTAMVSFVLNIVGALGQLLFSWSLNFSWQELANKNHVNLLQNNYMLSILLFPISFVICIIIAMYFYATNLQKRTQ